MADKKTKMSYSAMSDYYKCERYYYLTRIERWDSPEEGASLRFGGAVDAGIMSVLEKTGNPYVDFMNKVEKIDGKPDRYRGWFFSFDNPNVLYTQYDYSAILLESIDKIENDKLITYWEKELGVTQADTIKRKKKEKYKKFNGNYLKMFQRLCWLSMKHKGFLMIDAFKRDIMPKITKVHSVQKEVSGVITEKVDWFGLSDLVCDWEGYDKPIIFDLKTSRLLYDADSVMTSDQLRIYNNLLTQYNTNYCGYIILPKNPSNNFVCDSCKKDKPKGSRKRNCEFCDDGKYVATPVIIPQVIISEYKTDDLEEYAKERKYKTKEILWKRDKVLENPDYRYIFTRNMTNCKKYGLCKMYKMCINGDKSGYIKREKTK